MAKSSVVLSLNILLVFLLAISEIARVNGFFCERESQTYSGLFDFVCHNHRCDRKCIGWEHAAHGACHFRNWKNICYCYYDYDCAKVPPPSGKPDDGSAGPPSKGETGGTGKGDGGAKGGGGGKGDGGGGGGKGDGGGKGGGGGGGSGSGGDKAGGGGGGGGGGADNPCKQYVNSLLGVKV